MPLVKAKNFPNRIFAEQAQQGLESEGIPSIIKSPNIGVLGAGGFNIPQGADLYVNVELLERAREIIDTFFGNFLMSN